MVDLVVRDMISMSMKWFLCLILMIDFFMIMCFLCIRFLSVCKNPLIFSALVAR